MLWLDLVMLIGLALILSSALTWGFGWRHPARREGTGMSVAFLFLILFFAMWAGQGWIVPWVPAGYQAPWLSFLTIGLFISLLVLALAEPAPRRRPPAESQEEITEPGKPAAVFGFFFWIIIIALLITALTA